MSSNGNFIPRQKRAATNYGAEVHGVLSAASYDPATVALTDADVTELGDLVTANQAAMSEVNSLKSALKAATKRLSGPKGTHKRMLAKLRYIGNKTRTSNAPASKLMEFGIRRKKRRGTRRNAPGDAPEFSIGHGTPGGIIVRFRESGSASPRARAANAIGVQIAVVDAGKLVKDGEADEAPNVFLSRSPARFDSSRLPAQVRLYARWISRRGETGGWSLPLTVTVM